jgi:hypothetical protein
LHRSRTHGRINRGGHVIDDECNAARRKRTRFVARYDLGLVLGRSGAFEARMEVTPTAPERLPSRLGVAVADQEAPQFGGFAPELIGVLMAKPTAHARWDQRPIVLTMDSGTVCLH